VPVRDKKRALEGHLDVGSVLIVCARVSLQQLTRELLNQVLVLIQPRD
jgi:hypothetical protein